MSYREKEYPEEREYDEADGKNKPGCLKVLGAILKLFVFLIIAAIIGLFIFRSCEQKPPKALTQITWTENTVNAYLSSEESFSVLDCNVIQNHTTDGYFFVSDVMVLPEASQWQLTVSYNNSTLRYLEEEYKSEDGISTSDSGSNTDSESDPYGIYSGEPFVYILYDESGNIYDSYSYLEGSSALHSFRRIVFEEVPDSPDALTLAIYRARDIELTGGALLGNSDGAIAPWRWIVLKEELTGTEAHKIDDGEAYKDTVTDGLVNVRDAVKADKMSDRSEN